MLGATFLLLPSCVSLIRRSSNDRSAEGTDFLDHTNQLTDGKGEGFGNTVSIQTTAIIKSAVGVKRVYGTNSGSPV